MEDDDIRAADNRYYDTLLPSNNRPPSPISYQEQMRKALLESQQEYLFQQALLIEKNCQQIEKEKENRNALLQPIMRFWKYSDIAKTPEIYEEINQAMEKYKSAENDKIYLFPDAHVQFTAFLKGISSRIPVENIKHALESL